MLQTFEQMLDNIKFVKKKKKCIIIIIFIKLYFKLQYKGKLI